MERIFTKSKMKLFITVLLLGALGQVNAQRWKGRDLSKLTRGSKVYIYNVATDCFIGAGSSWGTQASLLSIGDVFTLGISGSNYTFQSEIGGYLCYIDYDYNKNLLKSDDGKFYMDQNQNGYYSFSAEKEVVGEQTRYTLKVSKNAKYLTGVEKNAGVVSTEEATDKSEWVFVTDDDLSSDFKTISEQASVDYPAIGTQFVKDWDFKRNNSEDKSWITGDGKTLNAYSKTESWVYPTDNPQNYYKGSGYNDNYKLYNTKADATVNVGDVEAKPSPENPNDRVDGSYYAVDEDGNGVGSNGHGQWLYGGVWTANIHGDGSISQTITGLSAEGWYIVRCSGFTTEDGKANLFAESNINTESGSNNKSTIELPYITGDKIPSTYAKAGKLLENSEYARSVMVYVQSGELKLGVEVNGTTNAWTCFDKIELLYVGGNKEKYLVLSELEKDLGYIERQVSAEQDGKYYMLRLQRTLIPNQWNSVVLPVSLDAQKVKDTFGGGVIVSELVGVDGTENNYLINFKKKDLSKDSNSGIEAYKLYIIKPTVAPAVESGTYTSLANDGIELGEHYLINQVRLAAVPENTNGIITVDGIEGGDVAGELSFKGTLIKHEDKVIPVGSFLLGTSGNWYLTQTKEYAVKGFRTWIVPQNSVINGVPVSLAYAIDGVMEDETTEIIGIENDLNITSAQKNNVYSINGQMVRCGTSLEGLAKGVYIVNNKKYIVK